MADLPPPQICQAIGVLLTVLITDFGNSIPHNGQKIKVAFLIQLQLHIKWILKSDCIMHALSLTPVLSRSNDCLKKVGYLMQPTTQELFKTNLLFYSAFNVFVSSV